MLYKFLFKILPVRRIKNAKHFVSQIANLFLTVVTFTHHVVRQVSGTSVCKFLIYFTTNELWTRILVKKT